jgi:hypothetical protein
MRTNDYSMKAAARRVLNAASNRTRADHAARIACMIRVGWRVGNPNMVQAGLDAARDDLDLAAADFAVHELPVRACCIRLNWALRGLDLLAGKRPVRGPGKRPAEF